MKKLLLLFFFTGVYSILSAQDQKLSGKISNSEREPLEFVIVTLISGDSILSATQTNIDGDYHLSFAKPVGNCKLLLSLWGNYFHEENINLSQPNTEKNIIVKKSTEVSLAEATVEAQKIGITTRGSNLIFTPGVAITSGSTAYEVLKETPMVQEKNDNFSLLFRSGTIIYLNGRPTTMSMSMLIDMLKGMPADNVKNIEIILNPRAKYEASATGGIINIVLRKNETDGFRGTLIAQGELEKGHFVATIASLKYRKDKLGIEGIARVSDAHKHIDKNSEVIFANGQSQENKGKQDHNFKSVYGILNTDYQIADGQSIVTKFMVVHGVPANRFPSLTTYLSLNNLQVPDSIVQTKSSTAEIINQVFADVNYEYNIGDSGQVLSASAGFANYRTHVDQENSFKRIDVTDADFLHFRMRNTADGAQCGWKD